MWEGIGEWLQSKAGSNAGTGDLPWLGWDGWVDIGEGK